MGIEAQRKSICFFLFPIQISGERSCYILPGTTLKHDLIGVGLVTP